MKRTSPRTPLLIANEFHSETVAKLDNLFETYKLWQLTEADQHELIKQIKNHCKAVATASWQTSPLIYQLPNLEIISCFGVGVDGIDFSTTRPRQISVTNTPTVLNDAVADIAMALILATQRDLVKADHYVRSGSWIEGAFPLGRSLAGQTLGIVGLGSIGEDIALRAQTFKLQIAYHNRHRKNVPYQYYPDLESLCENVDILLCMLPGGAETENVIDIKILTALGPNGTFINVGRGTSVNEDDLIKALQSGVISRAGLDVYRNEPRIRDELLSLNNVVLLPHIGSATVETRTAMGNLVVENLLAWESGEPLKTAVE
ncbi:MAG: 2-hydroxyacid dehydrogenase [Gammaproteobacteria bacterium]|jgi:lactate dehydrogenase-like 2-hydroxyacid dehydrogenase